MSEKPTANKDAAANPVAVKPMGDDDMRMQDVLRAAHEAIDSKKGEQITVIDVSSMIDHTDYMVIATGSTDIHNRALADAVEERLASYDIIADGVSGYRSGGWVLLDYGPLIVHIFTPELREFYRLDELWGEGGEVEM